MKTPNHPSLFKRNRLLAAFGAVLLSGGLVLSAHAANVGHSRLVSAYGQALRINIPVTDLTVAEASTLKATPAAASEWAKAGLTPPVDLSSILINLVEGHAQGAYILQLSSDQPFSKPIADLLLDIKTVSGVQRYQVSLIAQVSSTSIQAPTTGVSDASVSGFSKQSGAAATPSAKIIQVRKGDTMFAIAQRHAVPDVSVYQLMVALLRANPQAFIEGNLNLVKAGTSLDFPNNDALNAISDSEARKIFHQHLLAFEQMRTPNTESDSLTSTAAAPEVGTISATEPSQHESASNVPEAERTGDQLKLSNAESPSGASVTSSTEQAKGATSGVAHAATVQTDDAVATTKSIDEAKERVSQLEENVKKLNQALQSQGEAAKDIIIDGAKGLKESLSEVASAVAEATGIDDDQPTTQSKPNYQSDTTKATDSGSQSSLATESAANAESIAKPKSTAAKINHWVKNNLIATVVGLIAFFVALIAWLLLRSNRQQNLAYKSVTPEMVQEKLNEINLNLNEPGLKDPSEK